MNPDFSRYDRIVLEEKDIKKMSQYLADLTEADFYLPLKEGVLILKKYLPYTPDGDKVDVAFYFKANEEIERMELDVYIDSMNIDVFSFYVDIEDNIKMTKNRITDEFGQDMPLGIFKGYMEHSLSVCKSGWDILKKFLYLMTTYKDEQGIVYQVSDRVLAPKKPKKNKKQKKSNVRKITRTTYHINTDRLELVRDSSRRYQRHTESWTRRGHWRTLKNGKKIWIKPTTIIVGDERKIQPKEYRL